MNWEEIKKVIDAPHERNYRDFVSRHFSAAGDPRLLVRAAARLRRLGRYSQALQLVDQLLGHVGVTNGVSFDLQHLKADLLMDLREFKQAVDCYSSIILRSADEVAYANRALAYWELKNFEDALSDYLRAIRLNDANPVTVRGAGEMLLKLDRPAEAIEHLDRATLIKPNYSHAWSALGVAYYNCKNWLKAYECLKKALDLDPGDDRARLGVKKLEEHFEIT